MLRAYIYILTLVSVSLSSLLYGQNPVILERIHEYNYDGTEFLKQERYWKLNQNIDTLSFEERAYVYFENASHLERSLIRTYHGDSIVSNFSYYFPSPEYYPGGYALSKQREVFYPEENKRITYDTLWEYNDALEQQARHAEIRLQSPLLNQTTYKEYRSDTDSWQLLNQSSNSKEEVYDQRGCLIEILAFRESQLYERIEYSRDQACNITEERISLFDLNTRVWTYDTLHHYTEGKYDIIESIHLGFYRKVVDSENGRLLELRELDREKVYLSLFTYDQKGDSLITSFEQFRRQPDALEWVPFEKSVTVDVRDTYHHAEYLGQWSVDLAKWQIRTYYTTEYNSQGDQTLNTILGIRYDNELGRYDVKWGVEDYYAYDYESYCDGLLKQKQVKRNLTTNALLQPYQRIEYGYYYPAACGVAAESVKLYPNPVSSSEKLIIESEGFAIGATARIMDLSGRLVKEFSYVERMPSFVVDLTGIAPGLYIVELSGPGDWQTVAKVMVR